MRNRKTDEGRRTTAARRSAALAVFCLLTPVLGPLASAGCTYYSFTGAALPAHLRTVAVPLVEDRAPGAVPDFDRALTDALVERFADRTRLVLETDEAAADLVVRSTLQRYDLAPVAVTVEDRVQTRERVGRTFTASADYDPAVAAAEAEAAARVIDRLADDVFTAATSDW